MTLVDGFDGHIPNLVLSKSQGVMLRVADRCICGGERNVKFQKRCHHSETDCEPSSPPCVRRKFLCEMLSNFSLLPFS